MAFKTIFLKSGREGEPFPNEQKAEAAITPGHLIEYSSTSGKVKKHATQGGNASPIFAVEDSYQGQEIGDDYSADDWCFFLHCAPGDEVYAWLAQGEAVSIGDELESNGDGTLRAHTILDPTGTSGAEWEGKIYTKAVVARALEALDLATSGDSATRLKVLIV